MRSLRLSILFVLIASAASADDISVSGVVFSQDGEPLEGIDVSTFWRANGLGNRPNGETFDLTDPKQIAVFWGREGQMASSNAAKTNAKGRFEMSVHRRSRVVYAMNEARTAGGIGIVSGDDHSEEIRITLSPLVIVKGRFKAAKDQPADWTHAYVRLPEDPARPLAINRFVSAGSLRRKIEFRLPVGTYTLHAYGVSDAALDDIDLIVKSPPVLKVTGENAEVMLPDLLLEKAPPSLDELKAQSIADGRWRDQLQNFNKLSPQWHASAVRGIDKRHNVEDFRGQWLVIEFWGLSCAPCLKDHLPKLMEFSEEHPKDDRIKIVTVCCDFTSEVTSIKELEKKMVPIEQHVWKGKKLRLPIVLDNTFKTWERFGIRGLGSLVIVDPQGRIVSDKLEFLKEHLKGK